MNSSKNVKLVFAGDFCSRPSADGIIADPEIKTIIDGADIAVVNFETPLLPAGEVPKERKFFQHHDSVKFLNGLGFNLFNICNNHILDYGSKGVIETINTIGDDVVMGISKDGITPYYRDVNGVKVAFIPLCYDSYATDDRNDFHVNSISSTNLKDIIFDVKKISDYVVVLPHDGIEYINIPTPYIRKCYRSFVDWGADAIVATHPHCIQGMEMYKNAPIIYSTGNLFFNSKATVDFVTPLPGWYNGMIVKLSFTDNRVSPEFFFTKNIRNRQLVLDNDNDRALYFQNLCDLLSDSKRYNLEVEMCKHKLMKNRYLPAIDSLFRVQLRSKYGLKYLLKQIYMIIRNRGCNTDYLSFILTSNTERNFLLESLKDKYEH